MFNPETLEWISSYPDRVIDFQKCGDHYQADGIRIDPDTIEAAFRKAHPSLPASVTFLYEGWKVARIRPFRPLVYYAAFGEDDIFRCLSLSIRSLLHPGQYRGEIAVITSSDDAPKVEALRDDLNLGERLHIVCVSEHADIVDFCLARFRLSDPVFSHRQPLLYLDCDVVIDALIEPFLMQIAGSDKIHVMPEGQIGEGHESSSGHWFGWRMMAEDGMTFDRRAPGFSAGILASGQGAVLQFSANLALATAESFQNKSGERRPFLGYDQCVANYVFLKTDVRSFEYMRNAVLLFRLREGAPNTPPMRGRGFVHFLNASTAGKYAAMEQYVETL